MTSRPVYYNEIHKTYFYVLCESHFFPEQSETKSPQRENELKTNKVLSKAQNCKM